MARVERSRIEVLGRVAVEGPAGRRAGADLPGRQGRVVLASLVAADRPLHREVLADRVWGDRLPRAWARDLSSVVSKLRAALVDVGAGPEALVGDDGAYVLDATHVSSDLWQLRELVPAAARALTQGALEQARTDAEVAATLAASAFLPNEDAPWVDEVRAELTALHVRARTLVAEAAAASGDTADALRRYAELLADAPFHEPAHRRLIELHAAAGNRAEAVAAYEQLRTLLADEFGVDPSPETEGVYLRVLRERAPEGASPAASAAARGAVAGPASALVPTTRYARSGLVNIAYQVVGDGPDLVLVPGWVSNVELLWHEPRAAAFLGRLASRCRLILFDKRGTGLSDPVPIDRPPLLDERLDDVRTVMDAAGSERTTLLGFSEGGALAVLAAASHPALVRRLVLWGSWARQLPSDDFPLGWTREEGLRRFVRPLQQRGQVDPRWFAPSLADDPDFAAWFASYGRQSASPGMAISLLRSNAQMDVRDVLPSVHVPTLVLHRSEDVLVDVGQGRYLAEHIPSARLREFSGRDHWPWIGPDADMIAEAITDFVTASTDAVSEAATTTLLTVVVARLADEAAARRLLDAHGGELLHHEGPEVVGGFSRPGRAVDCGVACAALGGAAAVHTGEVARTPTGAATGPAIDAGRMLAGVAPSSTVLATRPVSDLTTGGARRFTPTTVPVDLPWPVAVVGPA